MIERIVAPFLTFAMLIAGHAAIVSALIGGAPAVAQQPAAQQVAAAAPVIQLERVVIVAKRQS